ncbi:type II and III secretion system protein family protein [Sulfuriflexus sp.]|uniref:type II and III secretion system protein family protein n=1 Tax=Sulfuriflexus sp. TaxID=2015443 RepID=UPI0028CD99EA|nr:type II and III secretion system protein family protein [Sulfuriflexus sp.]MDT8403040.1 type II and III secretion system protein family protein [Sulfuriflexus sp.]
MTRHMRRSYTDLVKKGIWLVALAMFWASPQAFALEQYRLELGEGVASSELELAVGKSEIIYSPQRLKEVFIGNPDIADVKLLSSQQVLVLGKAPGRTNLAFRNKNKQLIALMDIVVGYDIVAIKRKIHEVLPEQDSIEVRSSNDSVMLAGQASNALAMDTALAITRSFAPGKNVLNLMQVGGGQQVMLEARISEVSRSSLKDLGIQTNIKGTGGGTKDLSVLSLITGTALTNSFGTFSLTETGIFSSLGLTLQALEEQGLANTLAEPNIVALSGHEASFLAGGEFPVPVAQTGSGGAGGTAGITVEFKEFGVGLKFTPTVLSNKKINLKLNTEVSAIDTSTGTSVAGTAVPGITTRRTATTVEMADGQSFAIAGLLQNDINNAVDKFPGLGSLPVLGALFRSTDFQRHETELVVLVTPRLVKPVPPGRLVLPTDGFIPPSSKDQYLDGRLEGQVPTGNTSTESQTPAGIDGAHGHQL